MFKAAHRTQPEMLYAAVKWKKMSEKKMNKKKTSFACNRYFSEIA